MALKCKCGSGLNVVDSREHGAMVIRKRKCKNCRTDYTTLETFCDPSMLIEPVRKTAGSKNKPKKASQIMLPNSGKFPAKTKKAKPAADHPFNVPVVKVAERKAKVKPKLSSHIVIEPRKDAPVNAQYTNEIREVSSRLRLEELRMEREAQRITGRGWD